MTNAVNYLFLGEISSPNSIEIRYNEILIDEEYEGNLSELSLKQLYDLFFNLKKYYCSNTLICLYKKVEQWIYRKMDFIYGFFNREGYFYNTIEERDDEFISSLDLTNKLLFLWNSHYITSFATGHPGQVNHFWELLITTIKLVMTRIAELIF
jgi:hypothetical protein